MGMKRIFVFLSLSLVLTLAGFSQGLTVKFRTIDTDNGLSDGTVKVILKDQQGYIWMGTSDGLNRYNAYSFEIFKNTNEVNQLAGNNITALVEDWEGNLWIGTSTGLSFFNPKSETFTNYFHSPRDAKSISSNTIQNITIDSQNQVWISTPTGLNTLRPETGQVIRYSHQPNDPAVLSSNAVMGVVEQPNGTFWVITNKGVEQLIDKSGQTQKYYFLSDNTDIEVLSHFKDSKNQIWIGTVNRGVFIFNLNTKKFQQFSETTGLSSNMVRAIQEDSNGRIWIGTDGGGISIYDPITNKFQYLANDPYDNKSLTSNAIYSIYPDDADNVWIGTFKMGINLYSPVLSKFSTYQHKPGLANSLSNNSVLGVTGDREGNIWIATDGGGLDRFNPQTEEFKHYIHSKTNPNSISTNVVKAAYVDRQGMVWLGTYLGGLNRLDPKTNTFRRYINRPNDPESLGDNMVWAICEDHQDNFWIGTLNTGLELLDRQTGKFTKFSHDPNDKRSISSNTIYIIFEDSRKNLWIGSQSDGLNIFDRQKKEFIRFINNPDSNESLMSNNIRAIAEDSKGNLWIGTTEGLCSYDYQTGNFLKSSVNTQLKNPVVNGIVSDPQGRLWLSGVKGLTVFDPTTLEVQHYDKNDGLQGNEFNYTSSYLSASGRIYFGGLNGFSSFDPDQVNESNFSPQIVFTELKVYDKVIEKNDKFNNRILYDLPLNDLEKITLTHKENVFSMAFSSLDYIAPDRNRYQYKLSGFDENWIEVNSSKREAVYMNLSPGEYLFTVKGTNSDGNWSINEKSIKMIILPPWWKTWWFRVLMIILIVSIISYISTNRKRQRRIAREALEQKVSEATSHILTQKEELQIQQESLQMAITETEFVIREAVQSGNFNARISLDQKTGEWRQLGEAINQLFAAVTAPFSEINHIVNQMAKGDLTPRYEAEANGEVQQLAENLNQSLNELSGLLSEIVGKVEVIGVSSQDMLISSEEMSNNTGEIASAISEMSKGAQDQVQKVDEASALIENILQFSGSVGEQADLINKTAEKGVLNSTKGMSLIQKVEAEMKDIATYSKNTDQSIHELTQRSNEISRILRLIRDIATQTNLLALNAAIEAAQAGDAGRGFAVVATEIRKLAENSKEATKEIEKMISGIQDETKTTATLIGQMGKKIKIGEEATMEATHSFEEIASSYAQTLEISKHIVDATRQQTNYIGNVLSISEGVVVIAEETAAGTEEMAASSAELSAGMTTLTDKNKAVSQIVNDLIEKVRRFKI